MRILICHTYYAQRSGECSVVEREVNLLRQNGHQVTLFSADNAQGGQGATEGLRLTAQAIYSIETRSRLRKLLSEDNFDVAHVHNTWMGLSPAIYTWLSKAGLPVVKTIHNYRWLCPAGTFFRDGGVCEDCENRKGGLMNAVVHRCYRGSLAGSALAASRLWVHRDLLHTMQRSVDVIVVQNAFVRDRLVAGGFPADRMEIKGNFLARNEVVPKVKPSEEMVFLGRLEPAKGLEVLLLAAEHTAIPLAIFGQGPLSSWLETQVAERFPDGRVRFMGYASRRVLMDTLAAAQAVVFPSEWYESYPISIVEAMANGKPVIASRLGSMPSIVREGVNGMLFEPGNAEDLASKMVHLAMNGKLRRRLADGARRTYEAEMTPEANYKKLMAIYDRAIRIRAASKMAAQRKTR